MALDERNKLVAAKVTEFLKENGRFQKTIVFCVDEEHAARMRQALVNENADFCAENHRYVMRITGSDKEGQDQIGNFIDPESDYPVVVTTSRLLSTGVDAQTCRLIVLDRAVGPMTEFKQIVGRGTRVHEDTKKNKGMIMHIGMEIGLIGALLLSGCGLAARMQDRSNTEASLAAYKSCLAANQRDIAACDGAKLAYEADLRV